MPVPFTLAVVVDRHPAPHKFNLYSGGLGINRVYDNAACDGANRITHQGRLFRDLLRRSEASTITNRRAIRFLIPAGSPPNRRAPSHGGAAWFGTVGVG